MPHVRGARRAHRRVDLRQDAAVDVRARVGREDHHVRRVGERGHIRETVLRDRGRRSRVDALHQVRTGVDLLDGARATRRVRLVSDVVHDARGVILDRGHARPDGVVRPAERAGGAVVAAEVEHGRQAVGADLVELRLGRVRDHRPEAELGDPGVVRSGGCVDPTPEAGRCARVGSGSRLGGRAGEADRQRDGCDEEQPDAHRAFDPSRDPGWVPKNLSSPGPSGERR